MAYKAKVKKEKREVIIRTSQEKIEGHVFIRAGLRLMDMLNKDEENFVAMSDVNVYSLHTERLIFEAEFLVLSKNQIVLIAESYKIPRT
ncbi:MAG: hypothetical protein ACE5G9_01250 [Nitrospinales bacterium]